MNQGVARSRLPADLLWQLVRPYGRYVYYALRRAKTGLLRAPWRLRTGKLNDRVFGEFAFRVDHPIASHSFFSHGRLAT